MSRTMTSPFPPSTSHPGAGTLITVRLPNGASHLAGLTYQYPLKLISPPHNTQQHLSALVFLLSYGGGLVSGDTVSLSITVGAASKLSVVTQGHTKIFKSAAPDITTRQRLDVVIEDGAGLCLLPDPVQPFAESVYEQTQIFHLQGEGASLCLLDWVTQGRKARGEDWDFVKWIGRNEVWWAPSPINLEGASAASGSVAESRLLVRDSVKLDARAPLAPAVVGGLRGTMHGTGLFGTLVLRGPLMKALGTFFLEEFAAMPRIGARDWRSDEAKNIEDQCQSIDSLETWRAGRLKLEKDEKVSWSAANVRGCVVVKFGSATVEGGRLWIGCMLMREGSIAKQFGDQALMCVQ
ncbi:urease accessory protein UreD [Coniella lustricola]|uniref:Urease accessory protein UreD n=1 Tax=Coniella lustricola TaxID=2025994 RepID=A0A2T3A1N2_9PEZI|nr:urease accessory protein UreD [Coniella lustricola]